MLRSKDVHSHKTTNTKECNTKSKNIRILIIIVVASLLALGTQFVYEATIDSNYTGTVGTTNTSITPANAVGTTEGMDPFYEVDITKSAKQHLITVTETMVMTDGLPIVAQSIKNITDSLKFAYINISAFSRKFDVSPRSETIEASWMEISSRAPTLDFGHSYLTSSLDQPSNTYQETKLVAYQVAGEQRIHVLANSAIVGDSDGKSDSNDITSSDITVGTHKAEAVDEPFHSSLAALELAKWTPCQPLFLEVVI